MKLALRISLIALGGLLSAGCEDPLAVETRVFHHAAPAEEVDAATRLGFRRREAPEGTGGWRSLAPREMLGEQERFALPGGGECSKFLIPGGTLAQNVNRWRGQMGLEALSEEAVAALPTRDLAGAEGTLVELAGNFRGQAGFKLLGLIQSGPNGHLVIKMTGPSEVVDAQREAFDGYLAQLSGGSR